MRATVDFAPLFRSSVGFDRMLNALDLASRIPAVDNWPPYDIVKTGEDDYLSNRCCSSHSCRTVLL